MESQSGKSHQRVYMYVCMRAMKQEEKAQGGMRKERGRRYDTAVLLQREVGVGSPVLNPPTVRNTSVGPSLHPPPRPAFTLSMDRCQTDLFTLPNPLEVYIYYQTKHPSCGGSNSSRYQALNIFFFCYFDLIYNELVIC